ncbi:hypothetical protein J3B02_004995, partial [Coemansia erecta]
PANANTSKTLAQDDSAAEQQTPTTENAYIQAELKKLRDAAVPASPEQMRAMIDGYAKRIEALLLEGQQWSAKELRLSNTVKKLRADSKALEESAHLTQRKLEATAARNDELSEKLRLATASDRSSSARVRSELVASFAEKEKQLRSQIEGLRETAAAAQNRLHEQIRELQQKAMAAEEDARDREVSSLTQIRALKAQLRSAEMQSSDVTAEIQQHTRPLLLQIEELQSRLTEQRRDWARREAELVAQARDAAKGAAGLRESLQQKTSELAALHSQIAVEAKRRDDLQAETKRLGEQLLRESRVRADLKRQLDEAHSNIRQLSEKLESANSIRESPPALAATASAHVRSPSVGSVSSTDSRPRRSSTAESQSQSQSQSHLISEAAAAAQASSAKKLSAQITSLKAQLQTALKQKNEYSRSLVELSAELDGLRKRDADQDQLARDLDELKRRHETALVMLGEKTERVAELEADISEIKEAYRQQLESIFTK